MQHCAPLTLPLYIIDSKAVAESQRNTDVTAPRHTSHLLSPLPGGNGWWSVNWEGVRSRWRGQTEEKRSAGDRNTRGHRTADSVKWIVLTGYDISQLIALLSQKIQG